MSTRKSNYRVALGVAAAIVIAAPIASAQYTNDPFFDHTVLLSQAFGFESALMRLRIVDAVEEPYDADFGEVVENLAGPDFERFAGGLAAIDRDFALDLQEVLDEVGETVEDGDHPGGQLEVARTMLMQAYEMVIPVELRDDPSFKGAVLAQVLLGEGGVAEGLEEAFEEEWEFAMGWAATQRAKELWEELRSIATAEEQALVDEMIAAFDEIYPSPEPPETLAGVDPEQAETPAQRMLGLLESILDTQLYSGRDQARLIGHLVEVAGTACVAYDAGDEWLGRDITYAVYDHYAGETTGLGDLIGLFAPEVHEEALEAIEQLVTVEEDEEEGEESESEDDDDDDEMVMMTPAEACHALVEALEEGRAVLGG